MRVHIKCIMPYGVLIKNSRDSSHKPLSQSGLLPPFRSSSSSSQLCPLPPITIFSRKKCIRIFIYTKTNMMRLERRHFYSIFHIYSRTFAACRINKYICMYIRQDHYDANSSASQCYNVYNFCTRLLQPSTAIICFCLTPPPESQHPPPFSNDNQNVVSQSVSLPKSRVRNKATRHKTVEMNDSVSLRCKNRHHHHQ